jgi:hypothetical protein
LSLIHEALRKARREAEHRDDPGVVFPGGLTGRGRRKSLSAGIAVGALLTLGVLLIAGGGLWWVLRQPVATTHSPSTRVAETSTPPAAPASDDAAPEDAQQTPRLEPTPEPGRQVIAAPRPTPLPSPSTLPVASPQPQTVHTIGGAEDRDASGPPRRTAPDSREYLVDADLGYAELSLDYIVVTPTGAYAEINGLEVRVGSHVEGFVVEEITEEWVRLRDDRGPLLLRVPSTP